MTTESSTSLPEATKRVDRIAWHQRLLAGSSDNGFRTIPQETPVAFSYQGASYAVMMASPADLEDFAVGFSLSEGIVTSKSDIVDIEVTVADAGIVLRIELKSSPAAALWDRKRYISGPSGCGLCGLESLAEALRPSRSVQSELRLEPRQIAQAMKALPSFQRLNQQTSGVHAAAFWIPDEGIVAVREDVGRHNALDKLAGALARRGIDGSRGVVLLTSRVSVEMIQKAAVMGSAIVVAVSAPTALALAAAEAAGMTLIAIARSDGFEIFSHPGRVMSLE